MELTHFDSNGNARMVDVSDKEITFRVAKAFGKIIVSDAIFDAIQNKEIKKGDVLTVATTAGIMGAKKCFELIPMCHILQLSKCAITWELKKDKNEVHCFSEVKCEGKTGVEMEAITAVSIALLTVYDMCKAIDKKMIISDIRLLEKQGGKSGFVVNE